MTEAADTIRTGPERTKAAVRRGWWPGSIWAIPIAVLALVGWWLFRTFMTGGEEITIAFADVHGLKKEDTNVVYRGLVVGKVNGIELTKDGKSVEVSAHIDDGATPLIHAQTRFWLRGASPSLGDLSSLSAVLGGPTIVMEAGPGAAATHFTGLGHRPVVGFEAGQPQLYAVMLSGAVGGLSAGQAVKLRGFTVGEIKDVGFRYDATSGEISTPVTLALYPSLFHVAGATDPDARTRLTDAVDRLVQEGLRARLERDPPLVGETVVTLDIVPGASNTGLSRIDGMTVIPADSGGGLDAIVQRMGKLPLEEIAHNVSDATGHVDKLVASPELGNAIAQLNSTLKEIHQTADVAQHQIPEIADRLRHTAGEIESAAKATEQAAKAASDAVGGAPSQTGLETAMQEITEAARSVRDLANYLDRHPEAMIEGKKEP